MSGSTRDTNRSRSGTRHQVVLILLWAWAAFSTLAACDLQRANSESASPAATAGDPPGDPQAQPDPEPQPEPGAPPSPTDPVELLPVGEALHPEGSQEADDPAIWIHPTDRSRSLLFLSDKKLGIYAYDMHGNLVQHVDFGSRINNIDVRSDIPWNGGTLHCVAANLRRVGKLALLRIDPDWRPGQALQVLCDASSSANRISPDSYGFALYRRPRDGALFVFDKADGSGKVKQWRIEPDPQGVRTTLVRSLSDVAMKRAEGFVADDANGTIYLAEERAGIHQYRADPDDPVQTRTAFFAQDDGIEGDREGLSLYDCPQGEGYLVLSSQGNSTFKVYARSTLRLVRTFRAHGAHGTDGLDVTAASLPGFPNGLLVIHDEPGSRYLLYDWSDVATQTLHRCGH